MRIGLLGPLVVTGDDHEPIPLPSAPKVRAVLQTLALNPGVVVPTWELLEAVWGEHPPPSAAKALQVYVAELRRRLPSGTIQTEPRGYCLTVSVDDVDANRFEALVRLANEAIEAGDLAQAVTCLDQALIMWRCDPLVEIADRIIGLAETSRLSELRRLARESLSDARLRLGEHAQIIGDLEAAVTEEPLRERRWAQLMLGLYRSGRQADALTAYQRMRRQLADELGLEPSPRLAELERAVLVHDPSLDLAEPGRATRHRRRRAGLPASISSFVGRDREAAGIRRLLGERRLVTITGVGGCGKTRLAVHVAAQLGDEFPDGTWFVDLSPTGRRDVAPTFAISLGVHPSTERPMKDVLADYVVGQQLLIVVDNCEHVIDEAAALIGSLLSADSGLTVLATSREPLRITGEAIWRLDPLPLPTSGDTDDMILSSDAVRLFVERAHDVQPALQLDRESVQAIVEIVNILDGVPLAVELAAALANMMSPSDIRDRLGESITVLTRGARTASPRQQTLAATLDWGYQLLTPTEQATLRRLSVFAGGFEVDAARAVASPSDGAADMPALVWSLCEKSLLIPPDQVQPNARFRLLETTRQFAHRQLVVSGEQSSAETAFTGYYLRAAMEVENDLRGRRQAGVVSRLRADHENLRRALHLLRSHPSGAELALRMLTALQRYWLFRGYQAEWLEFATPLTTSDNTQVPVDVRARALAAQCFLGSSFDTAHARQWGREALDLACQAGDTRAECEALIALAVNGLFSDRLDAAPAQRAILLAQQPGNTALVGDALTAVTFTRAQDMRTDIQRTLEALEFLHAAGDHLFEVFTLNNLGVIYEEAGDLVPATGYTEQATELASQIRYGFPIGLANLAELRILQGQLAAALEPLETGLRLARRCSLRDLLLTLRVVVRLALVQDDAIRAAQLQDFFESTWLRAGFEPSVLDERLVRENRAVLDEAVGDSHAGRGNEGSSLTAAAAIELADQITGSCRQQMASAGRSQE